MLVALFCASAFACSADVSRALSKHGLWTAITVTLALETNVGATWRKSKLRAVGTLVGGVLGAFAVAVTGLLCSSWPPGAPANKVFAMSFSVALLGAALQALRARDTSQRDYAYSTCLMTLVLTSLSDFDTSDGDAVLSSAALRVATIGIGGSFALLTSLLVLPVYASQSAQEALASACRTAGELITGTVAQHHIARRRPTLHPHLHALELRLASLLERYSSLVGHAGDERAIRVGARVMDNDRACAAGAGARGLFTGAVSMLHVLEASPRSEAEAAMFAQHAEELDAATAALCRALGAAALLCEKGGDDAAGDALAALRLLDSALLALADAVAATAGGAQGCESAAAAHRELSALLLALQDVATCVSRVVANNLPDEGALAERWTAQAALAAARRRAVSGVRRAMAAGAAEGGDEEKTLVR